MGTRIYFPSSGTMSNYSTATSSGWEDTTWWANHLAESPMTRTGTSTDLTTVSVDGDADSTDLDILLFQGVLQDSLRTQTIPAQTVKVQFRCQETSSSNNLFLAIAIYTIDSNFAFKDNILAVTRDNVEMSSTALTNRSFSATTTAVEILPRDSIVVEVGAGGDPSPSYVHDFSIEFGDGAASDLPENDTSTDSYNPWIEFSTTLAFVGDPNIVNMIISNA